MTRTNPTSLAFSVLLVFGLAWTTGEAEARRAPATVLRNAHLSDAGRVNALGSRLGTTLSPLQAGRLLRAHRIGDGFPYTRQERFRKALTLMKGHVFSRRQARIALDEGFAGQYAYQNHLSSTASRYIESVIARMPLGQIANLEVELEQTFQGYKRIMEGLIRSNGPYAGIGVRTGAPYRAQEAQLEREYEQAMIGVAQRFAGYAVR